MFPVSLLLAEKYDSAGRAAEISAWTLIIAAENDGVIPVRHTKALAESFDPAQLQLVVIAGADHLSVSNNQRFWIELASFFETAPNQ